MNGPPVDMDSVLSGEGGVLGRRSQLVARLHDRIDELAPAARSLNRRLRTAASALPTRRVLVLGIYATDSVATMQSAVAELRAGKHTVEFALGSLDASSETLAVETRLDRLRGNGKFENLNALLANRVAGVDWAIVLDDDVKLPAGFLDSFLFCLEGFDFDLAQPALSRASHGAWQLFRRQRALVARQTRMVEIGPVTAFGRRVASELLPFPDLKMGWGLDAYWGGLALERGWRLGVVDATPVRHESRPTAASYDREAARAEAATFLSGRPHIDRATALSVVTRFSGVPTLDG